MSSRARGWIAWSACGLSVALGSVGLWLMSQAFASPREMLLSTQSPGNALGALTFPVVGASIVWHRPDNRLGWLLCGAGLIDGMEALATGCELSMSLSTGLTLWLTWFENWLWIPSFGLLTTLLPLIYPTGHVLSPRWRPVALLIGAWMILFFVAGAFNRAAFGPFQLGPDNPMGIPGAEDALMVLGVIAVALLVLTWVASVVSLAVRYRRAASRERQQIRWLIFAVAILLATDPVVIFLQPLVSDDVRFVVTCVVLLAYTAVPVSIGVAILRYRLYEIDLIIRRTLVYGALTAALGVVYWASVVVLQQVLRPFTQGSELAIVGSTLAVAALFQPLRQRIQWVVDRRFYRQRYDAARTVELFTARLRNEVDLDSLGAELLAVVGRTMQPQRLSLWLRPPAVRRP